MCKYSQIRMQKKKNWKYSSKMLNKHIYKLYVGYYATHSAKIQQ